jgi:hypothetical protein
VLKEVSVSYHIFLIEIYETKQKTELWEESIKMDLQEVGCGVLNGLSWFRME